MSDMVIPPAALDRLIAEAVDLCWKATPYGSTEDGDVAAYIVPKGVVHRLVGALQGAGVPAALRSLVDPKTGHDADCPWCRPGSTLDCARDIGKDAS